MSTFITVYGFEIRVEGLDPITVYFQDFVQLGKGRVTIEHYGQAWSCYFNAMGNRDIRVFFLESSVDYLSQKLAGPNDKKHDKELLKKIVRTAKEELAK